MVIHENLIQYSDAWWAIRCGLPTASKASEIVTSTGKYSKQSYGYLCQLIADKLGFVEEPKELGEWVTRGLELEPEARAMFSFEKGFDVREVGFITNDEGTAGASPDGLIYVDDKPVAGLEIKVVMAKTQVRRLIDKDLPSAYKVQLHWSLAVSGLPCWWFVSHYPGMAPLIIEVVADSFTDKVKVALNEFIANLAEEAEKFGL